MNGGTLNGILHYLHQLGAEPDGLSDGQLLERFVSRRDEAAFAALLRRHGPLVWGVCRRMLRHVQDAEDAFQATFLVLARRAGAVRKHESVRSWLYGVAYRVAARARDTAARRHAREGPLEDVAAAGPVPDNGRLDPGPVLDEEIGRLPEKYRLPLILCHLEGKSQEQAAQLLGCPRATVATRLVRGRERLRDRLVRRGVEAAPGVLLPAASQETAVPAALADGTLRAVAVGRGGAAAGTAFMRASILAEEVLRAMLVTRCKTAVVVLLALLSAGSGAGVVAYRLQAAAPPGESAAPGNHPEIVAPEKDKPAPKGVPGAATVPAPPPAVPAPEPAPKRPKGAAEIAELLGRQVKFSGFDADPKMTLQEGLDHLADRYELTFDVNEAAFTAEKVNNVLATPIAKKVIPKMIDVQLETVLSKILSRVPAKSGATFRIRRGAVEITTEAAIRAELGRDGQRPLLPLVVARIEERPLTEALEKLAASTGYNIVVDVRAAEKADTTVTATLTNVPLDTAVRILADMAELKPVLVDNVFYVTTRDNAARFKADVDEAKPRVPEMKKAGE